MTTVNVYLTFNGDCREAFTFYASIFNQKIDHISTYGEMPPQEGMPPVEDAMKDKIMHVSMPISAETMLMGSDSGGAWSGEVTQGNNMTISVNTRDVDEAKRIFNALAEGGKVTMPMEKTFWEAYFGMLTDKFGIPWMVNCELSSHQDFEKENRPQGT